jgi:hypothetical protein
MTRVRFTIARHMAIVLYLGFGFAALRNADEFWASTASTLAIVLVAAALVGASSRSGRARTPWVGFAVFGWAYLLTAHLPRRDIGVRFGPVIRPHLLVGWGFARLQPYIKPLPPGVNGDFSYDQVSVSLGIILFGLIGMVLGRFLALEGERSNS